MSRRPFAARPSLAALLALAVPFAACSAPGPRLLGPGADLVRESVRAMWNEHLAAARARDLEGLLRLYTDDCVYVVEGNAPIVGREAMRRMEQRGLEQGEVKKAFHVTAALRVDGDLAWEMGSVHGDVAPKGQEAQRVVFHYVAMWRLGKDRVWRIAHLVGQVEAILAN